MLCRLLTGNQGTQPNNDTGTCRGGFPSNKVLAATSSGGWTEGKLKTCKCLHAGGDSGTERKRGVAWEEEEEEE